MPDTSLNIDWLQATKALGERYPIACMEPAVVASLKASGSSRLLVACSGGADSVFMLCLLYARRVELHLELSVAHYNHLWRGDSSNQDVDYVRSLAQALSLPYFEGERPDGEAAFTETTARALRLDFLRKSAEDAGCAWIAFGHQLDDILETQLQRLARGVGSDGLAAPRPIAEFNGRPTHLRPLLNLRSGDIRMALNAIGIPWREDSTNKDVRIARNALRHEVIPDLMDALDRDPATGAARSRQYLEEDAIALDQVARERMPAAFSGAVRLSRPGLCSLHRALMRRALSAWLHAHDLIDCFSAPALNLLIETLLSVRGPSRQSIASSMICFDSEWLWLEEEDQTTPLQRVQFEPGEPVVLSSGGLLESKTLTLDASSRVKIFEGELDPRAEAIIALAPEELFEVRSWLPGDRFRPLGAPGTKKLKDWFIDRKIPKRERTQLPVVTTLGGEIIWVPGFPPAERLKIVSDTKQALRLTYRPRKPL